MRMPYVHAGRSTVGMLGNTLVCEVGSLIFLVDHGSQKKYRG